MNSKLCRKRKMPAGCSVCCHCYRGVVLKHLAHLAHIKNCSLCGECFLFVSACVVLSHFTASNCCMRICVCICVCMCGTSFTSNWYTQNRWLYWHKTRLARNVPHNYTTLHCSVTTTTTTFPSSSYFIFHVVRSSFVMMMMMMCASIQNCMVINDKLIAIA